MHIWSQQHASPSVEEDTHCSHTLCYKLHRDKTLQNGQGQVLPTVSTLFQTLRGRKKGSEGGRGVEVKGKEKTHVLRTCILYYGKCRQRSSIKRSSSLECKASKKPNMPWFSTAVVHSCILIPIKRSASIQIKLCVFCLPVLC